MRHTNIVFLLQMTKDYLDGKIDVTSYRLDFPYELETRYKKMLMVCSSSLLRPTIRE